MSIKAAELFITVNADTRNAEQGIKSVNDKMNSAARGMTMTGAALTAGITLPLVGVAVQALSLAGDFEQSMNVLQEVSGASADTMSALSAEALRLGQVTSFSAGEAAEGMLELAKAGMSTEEILASIGGVMDLAAAGSISLAEAAAITASALSAFHLEASESGRVADLLAAAAAASQANISDLSQGMQQAGFAFSMANQPIENLAASLAILTNVGLTGSDAGTALKNAFMRMMNPTAEASGLMKTLGINFYDAAGNMKGLPDIIDMLNVATASLTNEERDAALATIFLSDGMKAMIPLMDAGKGGFNAMVGEVTEVGVASRIADALTKGLAGGIEYLGSSVETFLLGAALPFLDTLGGLARGAGDLLTKFGELPQPVRNTALAIAAVAAAAGPVLIVLGMMAGGLAAIGLTGVLLALGVGLLATAWALNIGDIQTKTATAFEAVQSWFSTTVTAASTLATSVATAFANTSFPTVASMVADFKAGEFSKLTADIRTTAIDLMVNLDTELNITGAVKSIPVNAGKLRDDILSGLSTAIDGVDWAGGGTTFAGIISGLRTSVQSLDFSSIDWAQVFKTVLLGPVGLALNALNWVIGADSFKGLQGAVEGAIFRIPWTEMGIAFVGLGGAILGEVSAVVDDVIADLTPQAPFGPPLKPTKMPDPWAGEPIFNTRGAESGWDAFLAWPQKMVDESLDSIERIDSGAAGKKAGELFGERLRLTVGVLFVGWQWTDAVLIPMAQSFQDGLFDIGAKLRTFDYSSFSDSLYAWGQGLNDVIVGWADGFILGLTGFKMDRWDRPAATEGPDSILSQNVNLMAPPDPAWVTSLFAWEPSSPQWITDILGWEPSSPQWITDILGWEPEMPSWVRSLLDWVPGVDGNAAGTSFYKGGLTWVGERGPEIVSLPRGSRIYNNRESMRMAGAGGSGGGDIIVKIENVTVANDMDIHTLALKVATEIQRRIR